MSLIWVCLYWKVGTEVSEMAKSLQEARGSLISDIKTLNNLLSSLGETRAGAGCRLLGKDQAVGAQGSPAHWPTGLSWVPFG